MNKEKEDVFDDYFDDINLNDELENFYQLIIDDNLTENFDEKSRLVDIRNENYKRYNEIDLRKIDNLSEDFDDIVNEIKKIYGFISSKRILNCDMEEALQCQKMLDLVYKHLNQLNELIENELNSLEKENDLRQEKIKKLDYNKIDRRTLEKILNKYNDLVLYNAELEKDLFDNYKKQLKRKKYLNELYKMINLEIDISNETMTEKQRINDEISKEIKKIYEQIDYLEDLMFDKSKYKKEFLVFKEYFTSLIAYDDNNYAETYRVYNSLCDDLKIKSVLNYFETSLIEEIENIRKEEKFIYERQGIRNVRVSLDYISANYIEALNDKEKEIINSLYDEINSTNYNLEELHKKLKNLVVNIWKKSITNINQYNEMNDFNFICTNNEFIDEKHQAILITKKMLERVIDYSNYQIGFICDYNDNILYITENEDIMSVEYNDMSNLKTPKQIEQEFLNFKVCNRIALNGYITKITAVYFIDDGDAFKYNKAVDLSKQHGLPLILLKKDN